MPENYGLSRRIEPETKPGRHLRFFEQRDEQGYLIMTPYIDRHNLVMSAGALGKPITGRDSA